MRNVCFCPTRATPNAIYSWPWTFTGSIWPLGNPGESILFKAKAMNKECCIYIKESPNCLRKKINYRIATSQLFQIWTSAYEVHHLLQRVIPKQVNLIQPYCWISSQFLTFQWNMQHSKGKLNPRKLWLALFSGDIFSGRWRESDVIFSVYKPLICKGRFPHTKGDHVVSFALTHKIKPSLLIRRVHTHPYYKTGAAASPKAGLVGCPCGRDTLMHSDHRVWRGTGKIFTGSI